MEFPFIDRVATAIGHYLLIEETESRTAGQIHAKERELDIAQQMLRLPQRRGEPLDERLLRQRCFPRHLSSSLECTPLQGHRCP